MFRFLTAGESHGPCLTAIIEGVPSGLRLDQCQINLELARRQRGYGRGSRMKIEQDEARVLSGVRFGETLGSPITLSIHNRDWENWQDRMAAFDHPLGEPVRMPRPGHADLPGLLKYGRQDVRDILERASARETSARVAVGAVARQLLKELSISVGSHVVNIGGVVSQAQPVSVVELKQGWDRSELGCLDEQAESQMKQAIDQAKAAGDTLGGIFEIIVEGLPAGIGSYVQWDRRLDARIAAAVTSIPAIKGVEFGLGFTMADVAGSFVHDEIFYDKEQGFYRKTNRAGGLEGGMTNGEPLVVRAVMKPIPTLMKPLASVTLDTLDAAVANTERSDVCAVPAAAVVGEAMIAIILADALLEAFGGASLDDTKQAAAYYRQRIGR